MGQGGHAGALHDSSGKFGSGLVATPAQEAFGATATGAPGELRLCDSSLNKVQVGRRGQVCKREQTGVGDGDKMERKKRSLQGKKAPPCFDSEVALGL